MAEPEARGRPGLKARVIDQIGEGALRRRETGRTAAGGPAGDLASRLQGPEDRRHIVAVSGPRVAPRAALQMDPKEARAVTVGGGRRAPAPVVAALVVRPAAGVAGKTAPAEGPVGRRGEGAVPARAR